MIIALPFRCPQLVAMACLAGLLAAGCSKKSEPQTVAPQTGVGGQTADNAAAASFDQSLAAADAVAGSGDCMKALRSLLALEQQPLTQDQTQKLQGHFASLKAKIAEILVRDPHNQNAFEARDIMRRQKR